MTAKPIGDQAQILCGTSCDPGQGMLMDDQNFDFHKILKICEHFDGFCLTMYTKRKCSQLKKKMGLTGLESLVRKKVYQLQLTKILQHFHSIFLKFLFSFLFFLLFVSFMRA